VSRDPTTEWPTRQEARRRCVLHRRRNWPGTGAGC